MVTETEKIQLESSDLEKIQKFRNDYSEITTKLADVEVELIFLENQKENIENFKSKLRNQLLELRDLEIKMATELREKYGDGEFDINTGIFTPKQ